MMSGKIKVQSVQSTATPKTGIENKVANILDYTRSFGEAAAHRNDDEKVMTLLRFAWNFADAGNLDSAMVQLQRAYAIDPSHPEISAAERMLKQKLNGITVEENSPAIVSTVQQPAEESSSFDLKRYADVIGVSGEPAEIQECLAKAEYHRERNEHAKAKEMIAHAYRLDPFNASIGRIERTIDSPATSTDEVIDRIIREAKIHLSQNNFDAARESVKQAYAIDPLSEKIQQIDETINLSLKKELNPAEHCLLSAHRYFHAGEYRKAKEEIYLGYLIDPLNQQLASLEEQIDNALIP